MMKKNDYLKKQNEMQLVVINSLLKLMTLKDPETAEHSKRVMFLSIKFANFLKIKDNFQALVYAALLHDIGKIGVPDIILKGNNKLNDDNFNKIKKHPEMGYQALIDLPFLSKSVDAILHHHERIDGKGYPDGLKSNEISLFAKIISITDSYDAMTDNRAYKKSLTKPDAIREINNNKGTQFDEKLADKFIEFLNGGDS